MWSTDQVHAWQPHVQGNVLANRCLFCSATRCLRCGEGSILPKDPLDERNEAVWQCDNCGFVTTLGAITKLVNYFTDKLSQPSVVQSVEALEDMLEKSARLLHPNHYVVTLVRTPSLKRTSLFQHFNVRSFRFALR